MGETIDMKIKPNYYTIKIYLNTRKKPIILEGLTQDEIDNFAPNATSKMFIKYGPVIIRTENISHCVII